MTNEHPRREKKRISFTYTPKISPVKTRVGKESLDPKSLINHERRRSGEKIYEYRRVNDTRTIIQ